MNIDESINSWTFEETIKTAESLMEVEKNMFKWDVIRHLRDFAENYREQLKEYQQLEEQGRLIKLPCKVGDTVYVPTRNFISELQITEVVYNRDGTYLRWVLLSGIYPNLNGFVGRKIGNEVFLTKSEAESKLKELRGRENE